MYALPSFYLHMDESIFFCFYAQHSSLKCAAPVIQRGIIFHRRIRRVPKDSEEIKQEKRTTEPGLPLKFQQPLLKVLHD